MSRLVAVIPMKAPSESKTRLGQVLDADRRTALCLHLLERVVMSIKASASSPDTWIVGGDRLVRAIAREQSVLWLDDGGNGLNHSVLMAANRAVQGGASGILVLPADLGLLNPSEVDEAVRLSGEMTRIVLAPAGRDGGTNALLVPRGMLVSPHFGPDSFRKHRDATQARGFPLEIASSPGLQFDLDTPRDLEYYRRMTPDLDKSLEAMKDRISSLGQAHKSRSAPS